MPESRQLRRIASAPAELTSAFSTSGTESPKAVDWVRQTRDERETDKGRKHQEVVAFSSTPRPTDIIRNLTLERRNSGRQHDDPAIASSSTAGRKGFADILHFEHERREPAETIHLHSMAARRDSSDSMGEYSQRVEANARETVRRDLIAELDNNPGRVEAGTRGITSREMRGMIQQALRAEFERQNHRPPTLRERLNTDGNSVASYLGAAVGVIGVAGFVYTRWPNIIPH